MVKSKKSTLLKKVIKPKDAIKEMLDGYEFVPDFVPSTKKLFSKKSRMYYLKKMR